MVETPATAGRLNSKKETLPCSTRHRHLCAARKMPTFPPAPAPSWTPAALNDAAVGRSHRSKAGRAKLKEVIDLTRTVLGIPNDYRIAIVPGSDTGAVEMALWSLLGPRGVDVLAWESFGKEWVADITRQHRLADARVLQARYGALPDLREVDPARDVVFTWNGTTSGGRVPDGEWISADRKGLIICDATSAAFAMDLPWDKLDVVTWSWQKILGGEGAHGVLVLSPRAVARLESYTPPWPLPKLFRLTRGGKLNEGLFQGETINTPSMLAVEDAIDGLRWAQSVGGLPELIRRSEGNLDIAAEWQRGWADFLVSDPATRSCTSICLRIVHPNVTAQSPEVQAQLIRDIVTLMEKEGVAYDIASYRDAPPGLRLWGGATVESGGMKAVLSWLDWAFDRVTAGSSAV
jgi:phosphoserine aminotransferase